MTVHFKSNGSWSKVDGIYFKNNGSWSEIDDMFFKNNGSWGSVYSSRAPQTTDTFNSNNSASWRYDFGGKWRTDTDNVYQGSWGGSGPYRGCYFYNASSIRSALQADGDRIIDNFEIHLVRLSSGGYSQAKGIDAMLHAHDNQPGGEPQIVSGPTRIGSLAWGESGWFDLPNHWAEKIRDGQAGGIGVASGSDPYVILEGRNSGSSRGRLRVKHS